MEVGRWKGRRCSPFVSRGNDSARRLPACPLTKPRLHPPSERQGPPVFLLHIAEPLIPNPCCPRPVYSGGELELGYRSMRRAREASRVVTVPAPTAWTESFALAFPV